MCPPKTILVVNKYDRTEAIFKIANSPLLITVTISLSDFPPRPRVGLFQTLSEKFH